MELSQEESFCDEMIQSQDQDYEKEEEF